MKQIKEKQIVSAGIKKLGLEELLSPPEIEFRYTVFEKGELIALPNKKISNLYFVVCGKVKFYAIKENGQIIPVNTGGPGTMVGDTEYVGNGYTTLYAEAAAETECLAIPIRENKHALDKHIPFLHILLRALREKVYLINPADEIQTSVEEKLRGYINTSCPDGELRHIQAVSEKLGCSRRQLERCIQKLCENGELNKEKKGQYKTSIN